MFVDEFTGEDSRSARNPAPGSRRSGRMFGIPCSQRTVEHGIQEHADRPTDIRVWPRRRVLTGFLRRKFLVVTAL